MKAAVLQDYGQPLAWLDLPDPEPAADEVLIRVHACGVCHSDLHIVDGDTPGFKSIVKPRLIPGHEVVGTVIARGADVREPAVGQRVGVAWLHHACGRCELCLDGHENLCRKGVVTGLQVDGGYAELMRAKASHVVPVPETLMDVEAAPLFCAGVTSYRALHQAGVRAGQRVAVVGVGGLGHLAIQIARAAGAEVLALDVDEAKLGAARKLGAAQVFDARHPDTPKAVRGVGGAHIALVTSAARAAYDVALKCLRPTGTLSVVGLPPDPLQFKALALVRGEYRVQGSSVGTREDLRATLALAAAGKLRCHCHSRPLAEANAALDELRAGHVQGRTVLVAG